jgi:hypothetical protein
MILYNQFDRTVSRKPYEGTDRRSVSSLHKGGFTGTVGSNTNNMCGISIL